MRTLKLAALLFLVYVLFASIAFTIAAQGRADTPEPSVVSELQRLKVENLQLKIALAQANATIADRDAKLASLTLSQEQASLRADILKTLNAKEGDDVDWATLTLKPKPPPEVKTTPKDPGK
jgi:hypothetical protein